MDGKIIKEALDWVERETALRTKQSRMLSNGIQGEFLQAFSLMLRPQAILEIGTFTGYSTICLSRGLQEGGVIDALEINDELEDIILGGYARAELLREQVAAGSSDAVGLSGADESASAAGLSGAVEYSGADESTSAAGLSGNADLMSGTAHLHIGDARKIIPTLDRTYDLVYIDANKREYIEYYRLVFDKIRPGGYIIADNVLWSGKAEMDSPPQDPQTKAIIAFDEMIRSDTRVESVVLPIRDGVCVVRVLNHSNDAR